MKRATPGTKKTSSKKTPAQLPQKSTLTILREEAAAGTTTPIYFWKPYTQYGFLGQWYIPPTPLLDAATAQSFNCTEQYMMYHKALTFNDDASARAVLATEDPLVQKAIGRKVQDFTPDKWDEVKRGVVLEANVLKFGQGVARRDDAFVYAPLLSVDGRPAGEGDAGAEVSLKELLLATGDRELVEASPRDRIWGVGFGAERAEELRREGKRERWGGNLLGKALMEVRGRIRVEMDGEWVAGEAPGQVDAVV